MKKKLSQPKIIWVNFLHIYQPPWQQLDVIQQAAIESYEYLLTMLEKYPRFKATLNVAGVLVEQLAQIRPDLLATLQTLVMRQRIELVASAQYHALLPLLPVAEIERQIILDQETLGRYFSAKIRGFYLPEMAYSDQAAKVVKQLGYQWLILDPACFAGQINNRQLYAIKNIGLKVIFRDRQISKQYPPETIYQRLKKGMAEEVIITGTDGEIYGHRHEDWQGRLENILSDQHLAVFTVSQYLSSLGAAVQEINLRPANWESSVIDLKNNIPYALWQHPRNHIHTLLWQLVDLSCRLIKKYAQDESFFWARQHLDRGLSSCTFWWASATKPSEFSPLTWNPDMIDNGSEELIRSVRSLAAASRTEKLAAEKLYIEIKKVTWETHWRKYN